MTVEGRDSPCKVGLSFDPWDRARALQTGSPDRIVVREIYGCESRQEAERLEAAFHLAHAQRRGIGEWFAVNFDEADYWLFQQTVGPYISGVGA